jgi:hypothetical protein
MATPTMVTVNGTLNPVLEATKVYFEVLEPVRYGAGPDVLLPVTYEADVAADGTFSIPLPGTNDPQWSPIGWSYKVTVRGPNVFFEFYSELPYDAGTFRFSNMLPLVAPTEGALYAAIGHVHEGSGTAVAWTEVTGKPATFPPSAHDHDDRYFTETEVTTLLSGKAATGHTHDEGGGTASTVVKRAKVTSGNIVPQPSVGVWSLLTGSPILSIPAAVGDYVAFDFPMLMYGPSGSTTFLDLAVVVGGVAVRYHSTDTATPALEGSPSLYPTPSTFRAYGPVFEFVVTSGDLDSGNVNVRFAIKGPGVGTIYASTDYPLKWRAINHGPVSVS